jgi:hypothetical protein
MEPIRPPDRSRRERLVDRPPPRRNRRNGANVAHGTNNNPGVSITWDEDDNNDHEDALLRLAMEASLQEENERMEKEARAERHAKHRQECLLKYGLVQSRLRLMQHPSDPLVDTWLELIQRDCDSESLDEVVAEETRGQLEVWLEKRGRSSSVWKVLEDLLIKKK